MGMGCSQSSGGLQACLTPGWLSGLMGTGAANGHRGGLPGPGGGSAGRSVGAAHFRALGQEGLVGGSNHNRFCLIARRKSALARSISARHLSASSCAASCSAARALVWLLTPCIGTPSSSISCAYSSRSFILTLAPILCSALSMRPSRSLRGRIICWFLPGHRSSTCRLSSICLPLHIVHMHSCTFALGFHLFW